MLTGKSLIKEVLDECVAAFVRSPFHLDVKIFLLMQLLHELSYKHVDQILTAMEEHFGQIREDASNSYLLCNLNAI